MTIILGGNLVSGDEFRFIRAMLWCCSTCTAVPSAPGPQRPPREWCHVTWPYGPVPVSYGCGCKCRRHCTASSQHSFGKAKDLTYYTHTAMPLQDPKQYLCEAVFETTTSAGAELAPSVTQVTHGQAEQVDHLLVMLGSKVLCRNVRVSASLNHFKQRRGWRKSSPCSGSLSPINHCTGQTVRDHFL